MSIISVIGKIAGTAWKLGKVLLPIIGAFRQSTEEVDLVFDKIDEIIAKGGDVADSFFDRNMKTINDVERFAHDSQEFFMEVELLMKDIKAAAEDDTVSPEEAEKLGQRLFKVKDRIPLLSAQSTILEKALNEMN